MPFFLNIMEKPWKYFIKFLGACKWSLTQLYSCWTLQDNYRVVFMRFIYIYILSDTSMRHSIKCNQWNRRKVMWGITDTAERNLLECLRDVGRWRETECHWKNVTWLSTESVIFCATSVLPVVFAYISNIHLPVVPPPGGSLEMTPGNLRQRKSSPYRWK